MGNVLCCGYRMEEEAPNIEEAIPMEMFNESEDSIDETVEMKRSRRSTALADMVNSPNENSEESLRFRVMAEHFATLDCPQGVEYHQLHETFVPINLIKNSDKTQCLFHVSVYNSRKERVVDLTIIQGMGSDQTLEHVIYWRNPPENSWQLNFSCRHGRKLFRQFHTSCVRNVFVWATTEHIKNNSKANKALLLSYRPGAIPVPSDIKKSAGCVMHITAYNLELIRTLDLILIQGKDFNSETECYIQYRNPNTGIPQFSFTSPSGAEAFRQFFN